MELAKYLNGEFICKELSASTKKEAIEELAALMKECPQISNYDQFVKDVFEREDAMTTGIGYQIAVPHARTEAVSELIIALGRSKDGIDFESMDHQPVKLIFLIGTPRKDMGAYLRVLAYLTRLLKKDEFRDRLINAKTPDDMIKLFKSVESRK